MKALVTYMSQTGNTKKIAEAIYNEIECEKEIIPIQDVASTDGYDLLFVGFPVINFDAAEPAKKFLFDSCKGRKTALFITHALPANSKDADINKTLQGILEKCKEAATGSKMLGFFNCCGELAQPIANFLLQSPNKELQKFGAMRNETIGYPSYADISNAEKFAKDIIRKF